MIVIEIKCTINVVHSNHPESISTPPPPVKKLSSRNWSLVPKRLGITDIYFYIMIKDFKKIKAGLDSTQDSETFSQ